jgi:hypothetical protein
VKVDAEVDEAVTLTNYCATRVRFCKFFVPLRASSNRFIVSSLHLLHCFIADTIVPIYHTVIVVFVSKDSIRRRGFIMKSFPNQSIQIITSVFSSRPRTSRLWSSASLGSAACI